MSQRTKEQIERSMALLPGTLDILILKAASWRPEHGYGLARLIEEHSQGDLRVEEGALYPALHRLERQAYLQATWGTSDKGRRAKYYRLTQKGRRRLRADAERWQRYALAMGRVLRAT